MDSIPELAENILSKVKFSEHYFQNNLHIHPSQESAAFVDVMKIATASAIVIATAITTATAIDIVVVILNIAVFAVVVVGPSLRPSSRGGWQSSGQLPALFH